MLCRRFYYNNQLNTATRCVSLHPAPDYKNLYNVTMYLYCLETNTLHSTKSWTCLKVLGAKDNSRKKKVSIPTKNLFMNIPFILFKFFFFWGGDFLHFLVHCYWELGLAVLADETRTQVAALSQAIPLNALSFTSSHFYLLSVCHLVTVVPPSLPHPQFTQCPPIFQTCPSVLYPLWHSYISFTQCPLSLGIPLVPPGLPSWLL